MIGILILPPETLDSLAKSFIWSIAPFANIHLYSQSGYWDISSHSKPLLHFWSLAVEEQFYFIWPLLVLTPFKLFKKAENFFTDVESSSSAVKSGLRNILEKLSKQNQKVLILGQVPFPKRNFKSCLERPGNFVGFINKCLTFNGKEQKKYQEDYLLSLKFATDGLSRIKPIDFIPLLCKESCEIWDPSSKILLYRDDDHLSEQGGKYVIERFVRSEIISLLEDQTH